MERLFDPMKHPEWIQPQTAEWYERLSIETGEYKYPWKSVFDEPSAENIFGDKIMSRINMETRVLDVGCGHGHFTRRFVDQAKQVIGIDSIDGYIASAKKEIHEHGSLEFLVVDAHQTLPFPNASFDIIYSKKGPWLFHHGMGEGHRIIKPGGIVFGLYHCGTDGGFRSMLPGKVWRLII
ncbi:class I SAM-dependent methyltransferase [Paenibacillus sp. CAU 1782]